MGFAVNRGVWVPIDRDSECPVPGMGVFGIRAVELALVIAATVTVFLTRPFGGIKDATVELVLPDHDPLLAELTETVAVLLIRIFVEVVLDGFSASLDGSGDCLPLLATGCFFFKLIEGSVCGFEFQQACWLHVNGRLGIRNWCNEGPRHTGDHKVAERGEGLPGNTGKGKGQHGMGYGGEW